LELVCESRTGIKELPGAIPTAPDHGQSPWRLLHLITRKVGELFTLELVCESRTGMKRPATP
jgi:hypothetical protein